MVTLNLVGNLRHGSHLNAPAICLLGHESDVTLILDQWNCRPRCARPIRLRERIYLGCDLVLRCIQIYSAQNCVNLFVKVFNQIHHENRINFQYKCGLW